MTPLVAPDASVSPYEAVIEKRRVGSFQWVLMAMCLGALISDGLDMQLLAFAAPVIMEEWAITASGLSPVLAAALIGMAIGNAGGGAMGDRVGRRPVLIASVLVFGLATTATALVSSLPALGGLRLVAGLGFGAAIPNAMALVSEWMPKRLRTQMIGVVSLGTPIGGLIGAVLSAALIEPLGWRASFVVSGVATLGLCLLLLIFLPESPGFLIRKGRTAQAEAWLRRAFGASAPSAQVSTAPALPVLRSPSIFSRANLRLNIGMPLAHFCCSCSAFLFQIWLPVLLSSTGLGLQPTIRATFCFLLFCMVGAVVASLALARFGSRRVPFVGVACLILMAVALAMHLATYDPASTADYGLLLGLLAITGLFVGGMQAMLFALASGLYPLSQRATGIGLAVAAGRLGGVSATFAGGVLLSLPANQIVSVFGAVALIMILAGIGLGVIDRHLEPQTRTSGGDLSN